MFKFSLFSLVFVLSYFLLPAPEYSKVLELKYSELPFKLRIENCGIYLLSSFDVNGNLISLSGFDSEESAIYKNNKLLSFEKNFPHSKDKLVGFDSPSNLNFIESNHKSNFFLFRKVFYGTDKNVFLDESGKMLNQNNESILVNVLDRANLSLSFSLSNFPANIKLKFNNNLGTADLIGIDMFGNIFLIVDLYVNELPLVVKREIIVLDKNGILLSKLYLPNIKYLSLMKEFTIDREGNLYHLLSERESLSVIKWSGLNKPLNSIIEYPQEYNYSLHYNDFTTITEAPVSSESYIIETDMPKLAVSRVDAMKLGDAFVLSRYYCREQNLAPQGITAPDGDVIKTPSWMIVGSNARIPYKWGGFNTLQQYAAGLQNGLYAGDINTAGVSSYAVGLDCSGFVSRCWQFTSKYSTSMMLSSSNIIQYTSWDELKPGDAILKAGHVRMFVVRNPNGSFKTVEAAGRNWDVSYWSFSLSDLSAYTPRYYTNMSAGHSFQVPELLSATSIDSNRIALTWNCDSSNVKGYRLYRSYNGSSWLGILNENSLKTNSAVISRTGLKEYFRVSSVLNDAANSESFWSNTLAACKDTNSKKVLVVDGFQNNLSSWQGLSNPFSSNYATYLFKNNVNVESIRNNYFTAAPGFNLNSYWAVYWYLGDESTNGTTLSENEQNLIKDYLEQGGNLFISGSELGYDLYNHGSLQDREFFNNYLKASYVNDNALSLIVEGQSSSAFENIKMNIGQVYYEDYPDEIASFGESKLCFKYSNGKGAGIQFNGSFGNSASNGKVIYLSFGLESTANDTSFEKTIKSSLDFFLTDIPSDVNENLYINSFDLSQNYPNPFNPVTVIKYQISEDAVVKLELFDILGSKLYTLVNEWQSAGHHSYNFSANDFNLSSGIYFYRLTSGVHQSTKKMILLK